MIYNGKERDLGVEFSRKKVYSLTPHCPPPPPPSPYSRWRNSQCLFNKQLKICGIISVLLQR